MKWTQSYDSLSNAIAGDSSIDGSELIPEIVRLIEDPDIKKEIAFDEISVDVANDQSNDPTIQSTLKDTGGIAYPLIRINDYIFPAESVRSMTITCNNFLPAIHVTVQTIESDTISKNMPKDGDMVSVFMRTTTAALEFVRCDFIITNAGSNAMYSNPDIIYSTLNVSGVLFIPGFLATKQNTFGYIGTSREVLRHIAEDFHLGFAYNEEDNSDDFQNWISCNRTITDFMNELTLHSWKDNTSFYRTWIDIYYNLVYVNLNKYFESDKSNSEIDMTFVTNIISAMGTAQNETDPDKVSAMPKIFTNLSVFRGTPFYIKKWTPFNRASSISLNTGYSRDIHSFIHNQTVMTDNINDAFSILECVPTYNKEKAKTEMIMRGRAKYNANVNPDTDKERINYDFVNTYTKKDWYGVLYMINDTDKDHESNDTWSGNVHKNYGLAVYHNNMNLSELNKMYIEIECEGLNLQVQRGEYVPVYIAHKSQVETLMSNTDEDNELGTTLTANRMFSGYYYVDSIEYNYKYGTGDSFSNFSTKFTLKRREWPTPEVIAVDNSEILPEEPTENE